MKYLREIIIVILFVIIILQRECIRERQPSITPLPLREITTITEYTPTPVKVINHFINTTDTLLLPKYITIHDTLPIDTTVLLSAYFSKVFYVDTLQNDSIAYIVIKDTISQNRIINRQSFIRIKPITIYPKPKWNLYAGIGIGGYTDKFGLSGKILYISRSKHAYEISYNPIQKYVELSMFLKIK